MDHNKYHELLDIQIAKCKDNEYLQLRLKTFLETILPSYLNKAEESHRQRTIRHNQLSKSCSQFIERFLLQNSYTYSPSADLFFKYDGINYTIYREDDIQHEILSQISQARTLIPWKYKIKKIGRAHV